MSAIAIGILVVLRVLFSSLANVFQKKLVERVGNARIVVTSSLFIVSCMATPSLLLAPWDKLSATFWISCIAAAVLDVPGNVLLVGSLGKSDLSLVGPLNSLKPVVGMFLAMLLLREFPSTLGLVGVGVLAVGTWCLAATAEASTGRKGIAWLWSPAARWRYGALFFTSAAAVCIKPAVLIGGTWPTFAVWSWLCTFLSLLWIRAAIGPQVIQAMLHRDHWNLTLIGSGICFCGLQGLSIWLFQLIPVSYALALFQLSGLFNVYLGHKFFGESNGWQRFAVSIVMLIGAAFIILG